MPRIRAGDVPWENSVTGRAYARGLSLRRSIYDPDLAESLDFAYSMMPRSTVTIKPDLALCPANVEQLEELA
jgi:hypothetical protein